MSFNRGLISPKSLARVDLDRTRLSAEVMTNWLPKTQGAMTIRPGTKYMGSSINDTGVEFFEFVASTDDVALLEASHNKLRIWLGSDAHNLSLLGRPAVNTTLTLADTGWSNTSTGGAVATSATDVLPDMTAATTNNVTVTASSQWTSGSSGLARSAWKAADDNTDVGSEWYDTGSNHATIPSWINFDFSSDTGVWKGVRSYSIRAAAGSSAKDYAPKNWELLTGNYDTGTYAIDTGKWTLTDTQGSETAWASSEKRTYTRPDNDTGTVELKRHWRLYFRDSNTANQPLAISEIELFDAATAQQVKSQSGTRVFNATSIGALARLEKTVLISDTGTEHSLAINIGRGPITLRVGSSQRDDDYISETNLGTGYHNLSFTPTGNFYVTLQHDGLVDRIVTSLAIGDTGTVEITTPWAAADLSSIRYDQSADIIYAVCDGVRPQKIERRGTGRSWSVVDYAPNSGPFLTAASSSAKLEVSKTYGNTTMNSSLPFFTANHAGALIRLFHEGQGGQWPLGALDAMTDAILVTGINDTGGGAGIERQLTISVSGTWSGRITIERSFDGDDRGFNVASANYLDTGTVSTFDGGSTTSDTGTFTRRIRDADDNVKVYYRARMTTYTSGVALVTITYGNGGVTGIARVTSYNSNTSVNVEVLSRFSDTGPTDNWQQGYWSAARSFPTATALHGGRLSFAQGGSIFLSVSDDYENFDDGTTGDSAPLIKTLGSGPVDSINWLIALLRLLIGTAGAEIALKSSSLDEPVTADNASAGTFSTQGSANLRAVKMDNRAIFVQRSGQRVFMIGAGTQGSTFGDYENFELTLLVPDLLEEGVVSIAIQRQPDTRIHCVLADGRVAILTYEPTEEVIAWSMWQSDTGTAPVVERVAVLPGANEDAVFYHVKRTVNGATKRFLEKWALESECMGDTGLTWLMDCAKSYTDTGRTTAMVDVATHLVGESVVAWGSLDTGSYPHVDLSPDVAGVQTRYTVDTGGDVTFSALTQGVHHAVVGLPYHADWRSAKLAYAAEMGSALGQMKRTDKIAFVLYQTHNNGLFFGNDTGILDPLPRVNDDGAEVDPDKIFAAYDKHAMPFPGLWNEDSRICLRGRSPRPVTVLAAIPTVQTSEKV
jgi:hypothetical protein